MMLERRKEKDSSGSKVSKEFRATPRI